MDLKELVQKYGKYTFNIYDNLICKDIEKQLAIRLKDCQYSFQDFCKEYEKFIKNECIGIYNILESKFAFLMRGFLEKVHKEYYKNSQIGCDFHVFDFDYTVNYGEIKVSPDYCNKCKSESKSEDTLLINDFCYRCKVTEIFSELYFDYFKIISFDYIKYNKENNIVTVSMKIKEKENVEIEYTNRNKAGIIEFSFDFDENLFEKRCSEAFVDSVKESISEIDVVKIKKKNIDVNYFCSCLCKRS